MKENLIELNERADLQHLLFRRGFLISEKQFDMTQFPFYGNWCVEQLGDYYFMTHKEAKCFHFENNGVTHFLMGHCYNPFSMEYEELSQLAKVAEEFEKGEKQYWDAVNELTGVFVMGWFDANQISFITDPSGMQSAYYGKVEGNFMITSHPQIIGDLYDLEMDEFVKELVAYKWYTRMQGGFLPADLSAFKDVKRVVPNVSYVYKSKLLTHKRFYWGCTQHTASSYDNIIEQLVNILTNSASLITKKWDRPSVSLTGGIDSNTTFAAFKNVMDKITAFSYHSAPKELPDIAAAKQIADRFEVDYKLYEIPEDNSDISDFDLKSLILKHGNAYISRRKENDIRNRLFLEQNFEGDIDVKSWVSETIRSHACSRFGRYNMPKLSPKLFRNLYKIFISNRVLAHKIDKLFTQYIEDFGYKDVENIEAAVIFYWEVILGSWGGGNISEMKYIYDITIPYNNRKFIDLALCISKEKRFGDEHHKDMKRIMNKDLYDMNINVKNALHTNYSEGILNFIFTTNMILPF